jgi:hypothetical protein
MPIYKAVRQDYECRIENVRIGDVGTQLPDHQYNRTAHLELEDSQGQLKYWTLYGT